MLQYKINISLIGIQDVVLQITSSLDLCEVENFYSKCYTAHSVLSRVYFSLLVCVSIVYYFLCIFTVQKCSIFLAPRRVQQSTVICTICYCVCMLCNHSDCKISHLCIFGFLHSYGLLALTVSFQPFFISFLSLYDESFSLQLN